MTDSHQTAIVVIAAVIERDGHFLLAERPRGAHLAGCWEFPGGKCEPGESHVDCLVRELDEELGVRATVGDELIVTEHAYPDRVVRLHFRRCTIEGEPTGRLGQQLQWIGRSDLRRLELPEADRDLVDLLSRPGPKS